MEAADSQSGNEKPYRFQTEDELVNFYLNMGKSAGAEIFKKSEIYSVMNQVRGEPFSVPKGRERDASLIMLERIEDRIQKILAERWGV